MPMKSPSHPGSIVLHDCIEALGISIASAAEHLKVDETQLSAVCACESPITADLAIRFEQAFGSTADHWLRIQNAYDLAQARKTACNVKRIERAA